MEYHDIVRNYVYNVQIWSVFNDYYFGVFKQRPTANGSLRETGQRELVARRYGKNV